MIEDLDDLDDLDSEVTKVLQGGVLVSAGPTITAFPICTLVHIYLVAVEVLGDHPNRTHN